MHFRLPVMILLASFVLTSCGNKTAPSYSPTLSKLGPDPLEEMHRLLQPQTTSTTTQPSVATIGPSVNSLKNW
jgi:hypothetical protein